MKNVVMLSNESIGHVAAEADDAFLFECFVDHEVLSQVQDKSSPKMVLLGSTGSGKTALLRMIEKNQQTCHSVELDEVSLNYVSNSDVINFLSDLGVPLDHFFQALWKHVIASEYIKLRFGVDDEARSSSFWRRLSDSFGRQSARKKALSYLEKWKDKFWVEFDENVRELTQSLERQVQANFGAEIDKYKVDSGYVRKLGEEKKSSLQRRLRQFVDADLLSELGQVIQLLADYDNESAKTCYVILDRLDENWVSPGVKYHLIRALIESLKSLRKIRGLKVVVAMRSDVMEKVIHETRELGFQSEKYADYIVRLFWDHDQMKSLVNKRINLQFRRKYTKANVFFEDIFAERVDKQKTFAYLLDRTLMRPRDIISFVNLCFAQANGRATVGKDDVKLAERIYSEDRRKALIDEWLSVFPGVEPTLSMLKGRRAFFPLHELNTSDFLNDSVRYFFDRDKYNHDPLTRQIEDMTIVGASGDFSELIAAVFERLYLIGAIGLNPSPESPVQWFYKTQRRLDRHSFGMDAKVRVHPMLYSALAIRP